MLNEQIGVERVGMIEIKFGALGRGQMIEIAIVSVVQQNGDTSFADDFVEGAGNGGFARPRSTGEPDDDGLRNCHINCLLRQTLPSLSLQIPPTILKPPHRSRQTRREPCIACPLTSTQ